MEIKDMLEFIVDNLVDSNEENSAIRDRLHAACLEIIKQRAEKEAEKARAKYIADAMAKLSGNAARQPKPVAQAITRQETHVEAIAAVHRKKQKINQRPERVPEKYSDLTESELRQYRVGEDMLLDYNIRADIKYIPPMFQSWVAATFSLDPEVISLLARLCKKISEELDLGYTLVRNDEFDPYNKKRNGRRCRIAYAAPVYLELKRRYDNCELSGGALALLRKAELKKYA